MSELRGQMPLAALSGLVPGHTAAGRRAARPRGVGTAAAWTRGYLRKLRIWDTAAVTTAVAYGAGALGLLAGLPGPSATSWLVAAVVAVTWLAMLSAFRTRDLRVIGVGPGEYKRVVSATAAAFGLLAAVFLLTDADGVRVHFLATLPLGAVLLLGGRWSLRHWLTSRRHQGHYLSRVLVLGSQEDVAYVVQQIDKKSGAAYLVVGAALEDPENADGPTIGRTGIPIIGGLDDVVGAAASLEADAVIVAGQLRRGSGYLRELGWSLEASATELVVALSLTNVAGPRIQMRPVEGLPLMHVDLPQFSGFRHLLKRAVDIAASGLALILLAPLFAVLAILIRRDSAGGAIFRQERVCRDGQTFQMYKFRSMVQTAEEELAKLRELNEGSGPLFKMRDDPRITKVGKWMRKYSLDELPQFFNVLKGDMSLVGPRPPLPCEVADYQGPAHRRLFTKPGLTGLWQVNGRSNLSWEESIRLDLYYVENWSLTGDIQIMWRTLMVMLRPEGAY